MIGMGSRGRKEGERNGSVSWRRWGRVKFTHIYIHTNNKATQNISSYYKLTTCKHCSSLPILLSSARTHLGCPHHHALVSYNFCYLHIAKTISLAQKINSLILYRKVGENHK